MTDTISDQSFRPFILIDLAILDIPLTTDAFRVYAELKRYANKIGGCFPSYKTLGECFRGSYPKSKDTLLRQKAIAAVKELLNWGLVRKEERRKEDDSLTSNQYILTPYTEWKETLVVGDDYPSRGGRLPLVVGDDQVVVGDDPNKIQLTRSNFEQDPVNQSPLTPQGDECVGDDGNLEPDQNYSESVATLLIQTELFVQTDSPSCSSIVPASFDEVEQLNKATDVQIKAWFLKVYQQEKPSNFTEHKEISSAHLKKIKQLIKEHPQDAIAKFKDALIWVREQKDGWWRDSAFSLGNLMSNGKIPDFADKHATAMKHDRAYRDRVEGKKPSMDKGRSFVVDEAGNQETGAMADIARAYATDPIFRMLMEAGK